MKLKHIAFSMFLVLAIALAPIFASAALTLGAGVIIDSTHPLFGSSNQRASNPLHDDGPVVVTASSALSIQNTETVNLSSFSVAFIPLSQYHTVAGDLQILSPSTTILAGQTGSLELSAKVPDNLEAVDQNLNAVAFKIGTLTITAVPTTGGGAPVTSAPIDVYMQRENLFEVSKVRAEVNSKGKQSIGNSDEIKDLRPGDQILLTMEVENNFDDNDNVDIESAEGILDCSNNQDIDIDDKNLDLSDISANDKDEDNFDINVEDDADAGSISCDVVAKGTDSNGAKMGEKLRFTMKIKRESHDIQIKLPITSNPQVITCDASSLQMSVNMMNLGKSDENRAAVEVSSTDLSYQQRKSDISMDENDAQVEIFDISLEKLPTKTPIPFTIRTFYDNIKSSDTETFLVDNTCNTGIRTDTGNEENQQPVGSGSLTLEEGALSTKVNKFNSLSVQVTNNGNTPIAFEVGLSDVNDFATPSSAKAVQLQPGQTSTVFLNFKTKVDIEEGSYTGTVVLKSGGQTIDSKLFTVEVASGEAAPSTGSGTGSIDTTKVFWVIGDIILIIVAIFFIRLIFTGGKGKKGDKKMADYEAAAPRPSRR